MLYDPWKTLYDCNDCNRQTKVEYGCNRKENTKLGPIVKIKCICDRNKQCKLCKGTNLISINVCPNKTATNDIRQLVPFFMHYKETKQFPDNGCYIDQPNLLIDVFNLMTIITNRKELELQQVKG
jgi:hypothetical protein